MTRSDATRNDGHAAAATATSAISFGRRLAELAAREPERPALIFAPREGGERVLTRRWLDRESNRAARLLAARGAGQGRFVVVALRNSPAHYVAVLGAWKAGACVLPLSPALPELERSRLLALARPAVVVAEWSGAEVAGVVGRGEMEELSWYDDGPVADVAAWPGKAIASGGSTGLPKVIVDPTPWAAVPGAFVSAAGFGSALGMRSGQVQLVAGPLYHNAPFTWSHLGLFEEHVLVLMERFEAARWVELVERYRVQFGFLVPTMMQRVLRLAGVERRDFSSVESFFHSASPCPAWAKEGWIRLIGGERLYEGFGATEGVGITSIRGDEWLAHRGSVGRPVRCDLRILDDEGRPVPPGVVGEVYMRPWTKEPTYAYLGAPPARTRADGFVSVGDLGRVDEEGWLYPVDRRVDLILTGGANVYPAEVEAALTEHPAVQDAVVIGLADAEWGQRVHAVVQPRPGAAPPTAEALDRHVRERISAHKAPKSYEIVAALPRDEAGKIRRSALIAERAGGAPVSVAAGPVAAGGATASAAAAGPAADPAAGLAAEADPVAAGGAESAAGVEGAR